MKIMGNWLFDTFDIDIGELVGIFIEELISFCYANTVSMFIEFCAEISSITTDLFASSWVKAFIGLFYSIGFALFVIGTVVAIFDYSHEYMSGKGDFKNVILNCVKAFIAVELFTTAPIALYAFSISAYMDVTDGLIHIFAKEENFSLLNFNPLLCAVLEIAMVVCFVKVFFGNIKRGGILLTLVCVGSLYMLNLPRGYNDGFMGWVKQVIALSFTNFMQMVIMYMGVVMIPTHWLIGIGLIMSATEIPRILDRYGLDTSTRTNVPGVAMTANSVMSGIRLLRK